MLKPIDVRWRGSEPCKSAYIKTHKHSYLGKIAIQFLFLLCYIHGLNLPNLVAFLLLFHLDPFNLCLTEFVSFYFCSFVNIFL